LRLGRGRHFPTVEEEKIMNAMMKSITVLILDGSLAACSGMTHREQNTAVGAAGGAVLGNVLTGGSILGTVGGAAVGGVIGHETTGRR